MRRPKFTPKTALPFDDQHPSDTPHLIHPFLDRFNTDRIWAITKYRQQQFLFFLSSMVTPCRQNSTLFRSLRPIVHTPHSPPQTASVSNQPFCHNTLCGQTNRQTADSWFRRMFRNMSRLRWPDCSDAANNYEYMVECSRQRCTVLMTFKRRRATVTCDSGC